MRQGSTRSTTAPVPPLSAAARHTVNRHAEHIFAKLGVDNRQKAIVAVMERLGM